MKLIYNRRNVLLFCVTYILFMCCFFYFRSINEYRQSVLDKAVIIDKQYAERRRRKGADFIYPIFEFTYHDTLYTSWDMRTLARNKKIGDDVTIIYPEGHPEYAKIYHFLTYWTSYRDFLVSGAIAVVIFWLPRLADRFYNSFIKK